MKILLILFGGAAGSLLRHYVGTLVYTHTPGTFPTGTLAVNLIGSFVIGLVWGLFEATSPNENLRLFLIVGILGGFTTFSALSLETLNLFRNNEIRMALLNILLNNILGLTLAWTGWLLGSRF